MSNNYSSMERTFPKKRSSFGHQQSHQHQRKTFFNDQEQQSFPQKRMFNETRSGIKAWRLIVRGLDDFTKREELEEHFGKCGKLKEIVLPKSKIKENANAPFGFIQYNNKLDADRAIEVLNNQPFKGRPLKIEISMDKDSYITKTQEAKEVAAKKAKLEMKEESSADDAESSDQESEEEEKEEVKPVPKKSKKPAAAKKEVKKGPLAEIEDLIESSESEDDDEEAENDETEEESSEEEDDFKDIKDDEDEDKPKAKPKKETPQKPARSDTAVEEERVIFLRNLPYDVTNESLKETMEEYGEVTLAILCTFKDSGHSTGTAFVHYKEKEDADKALEALQSEAGVVIEGRKIFGHRAVPKEKAGDFKKPDKTPSDNRNLYLLRVSLIRPGTAQANDMSEEDASKRASLLSLTKQKLKNLHMFVSPTRLAIHNVPFSMNEKELLQICKDAAKNPKAYITECRIMRKKLANNDGGKLKLGASKGFAFVEFKSHEDALNCLKKMNNNPDIFKKNRRPIVEFSIENRAALNLRQQRALKNEQPSKNKKKQQKDESANQAAVEKTKKALMKGGAKPLPKKFFKVKGGKVTKKSAKGKKKAAAKKANKKGAQKK